MSREFHMPSLGADMEAATLVKWSVVPGTRVRRGETVALVETDKGIIDIESFEDGVVERLIVEPGTRVPVGATLALFEGDAPTQAAPAPPRPAARISPAARKRASELNLDPAALHGTGPQGAVTLEDVEQAAKTQKPTPAPAVAPRDAMRHAIAASMSRSKREIPHYYLQLAMDCSTPLKWLEEFNNARAVPERLLTAVLLIKAVAKAAAANEGFSGYYGPQGFEPKNPVHVGVAIAVRGGGLVAPALLEVDRKPLTALMPELTELVNRARAGHLRSGEVAAPTLTVTNLGDEGVDTMFPIIHPPQVAMVAFGSVLERAWAVEGRVEARPVINIALAADHRVTDGRQGAQFLMRIQAALLKPQEL